MSPHIISLKIMRSQVCNFKEIPNIVVFVRNVDLSFLISLILVQEVQPFLQNISQLRSHSCKNKSEMLEVSMTLSFE